MRFRTRALAQIEIDAKNFQHGIEELFNMAGQAVDFINEKDFASLEAKEVAHDIASPFQRWGSCGYDVDSHLVSDDVSERRFA
jgi:N-acetylglutamate synthase-like GNAT family acetyltransferase